MNRTAHRSAVLVALLQTPAMAEPCAPRAELAGDPAAVAQVGAELAQLGVERGAAAPGCRGVFAQVQLEQGGAIAVAIRDGGKRSEGRVVSDAAMAASWIDSWLHDDLDGNAWLLAAPMTTPPVMPVVMPPVMVERRGEPPIAVAPVRRPSGERFAIAAAYEQSWLAGTSASGVTGHACVRVGRACVGGRVRYAREPDRTVNQTGMARKHTQVLATAGTSFALGRMTITPELGLGFGWTTTRRVEACDMPVAQPPLNGECMDPNSPMDPTCQAPPVLTCLAADGTASGVYVGDKLEATTIAPRLSGALRISIPLFDRVWLDGLAAATFAPLSHGDPFTPPANAMPNPDGSVPGGGVAPELIAIPGESAGALTLGIGLRVGL